MLLKLHKYAGLIVGLLLALTGVTGSLLVFHDTLDEWLTPQLRTEPAAEAHLYRYVLHNRRWFPEYVRSLGSTPRG